MKADQRHQIKSIFECKHITLLQHHECFPDQSPIKDINFSGKRGNGGKSDGSVSASTEWKKKFKLVEC